MPLNTLTRELLNMYDHLTPSEGKVAEYVIDHPEAVVNSSSRELAKAAGVSLGTVINFCRTIGVGGFGDLRVALAKELGQKQLLSASTASMHPFFRKLIDVIVATDGTIDLGELEKASRILGEASSVVLFGGGGSGKVCHLAAEMLVHFGRLATSFDQLSTLQAAAQHVTHGTAVVVVSHRGKEVNVVQTLKLCHQRGGRTICITNSSTNPLARECDAVLQTSVKSLGSNFDLIVQPVREGQLAVLHLLILTTFGERYLNPVDTTSVQGR